MFQTANATVRIQSFVETPFADSEGGPRLTRRTCLLSYEGDLRGEGILEELKVLFSDKRAVISGLMRFSGWVNDFNGSFVLKHVGKIIRGRLTSTQTVVPGSATGHLKGLRGEIELQSHQDNAFLASLRYRFA